MRAPHSTSQGRKQREVLYAGVSLGGAAAGGESEIEIVNVIVCAE